MTLCLILDCCDGSDEYSGRIACKNKCIEEGAASRKQLTEDIAKYSEGAQIRSTLVEEYVQKKSKWSEEIEKLKSLKEELVPKEAKLLGMISPIRVHTEGGFPFLFAFKGDFLGGIFLFSSLAF